MLKTLYRLDIPLKAGACLMFFYGIFQYIITLNSEGPISYEYFTIGSSQRVLFFTIIGFLTLYTGKLSRPLDLEHYEIRRNWGVLTYFLILISTLTLCYLYPWGTFGDIVTTGHSYKAYARHLYNISSLMLLIYGIYANMRRRFFILISIDVMMLFLDPSRVYFIESIVPKIFFFLSNEHKRPRISYVQILVFGLFIFASAAYAAIYRLDKTSEDFISWAVRADITLSTYPALQLSHLSSISQDFFINMNNAENMLGEVIAPMGGAFFTQEAFISNNQVFNILYFLGVLYFFKILYKILAHRYMFVAVAITGLFLILFKLTPVIILKIILANFLSFLVLRRLMLKKSHETVN